MESAINSSNASDSTKEDSSKSNAVAKLRRLRIKENILAKSICKTSGELQGLFIESEDGSEKVMHFYSGKRLVNDLRSRYIEIRDLFEEIKTNTSQENLESLDIEEIKKDVLDLENKAQNFKTFLRSKRSSLETKELEIIKQIDETCDYITKRPVKTQMKTFTEIVPSPVKNLIHSPFKCPEVQDFQDFLANSKNRCGGWIPYDHDIFEKSWSKYFCVQRNIENLEYQDTNVENSELFEVFLNDVCNKIPGISVHDIITHNRWYTKYIYLKERQRKALEKWRMKRQLTTSSGKKYHTTSEKPQHDERNKSHKSIRNISLNEADVVAKNHVTDELKKITVRKASRRGMIEMLSFEDLEDHYYYNNNKSISEADVKGLTSSGKDASLSLVRPTSAYRNPTLQWYFKCNGEKESTQHISIEHIQKRRIPDWRKVL